MDNILGYVVAVLDADTAIDACILYDNAGAETSAYDYRFNYQSAEKLTVDNYTNCYRVYEVSDGFDVEDGRDDDEITAVESHRLVAVVTYDVED